MLTACLLFSNRLNLSQNILRPSGRECLETGKVRRYGVPVF